MPGYLVTKNYIIKASGEKDLIAIARKAIMDYFADPNYAEAHLPTDADDAAANLIFLTDLDAESTKDVVTVMECKLRELPL